MCSQTLRIKWICTTPNDFNQYCEELKQRFDYQGYKAELINKSSTKNEQEKTFKRKTIPPQKTIALVLTCNRSLPNISRAVR